MEKYAVMREHVDAFSQKIKDDRLREMFLKCFYSTLETTTERLGDGTTFVFTGDIPAMWLRDSSVQVSGYLPYAKEDGEVAEMIKGLIRRQCDYILHDPYSNAFNKTANGAGHQSDETEFMSPRIWERKYEVDSLCYPLWLVMKYYAETKDIAVYDQLFKAAAERIAEIFIIEQNHNRDSKYRHYRDSERYAFSREEGSVVGYTGMTWSAYRPSDDPCSFGYLIPANQFATVVLADLAGVFETVYKDVPAAKKMRLLCGQIEEGIQKYGVIEHGEYGRIYAYEVDGLGGYNLMDDANVPSLLSLPYLGYCGKEDELYQNTRKFVLGRQNPYYFEGKAASGIGSPHTPDRYIWHIAIVMQLLTSNDREERKRCFERLLATDAGCGVMHEGFHADDPKSFTREWFAWANTLFAVAVRELVMSGEV